jgi:hypothetical protein
MLLSGTPLSKVTDKELLGLDRRHGFDRLERAADIAAETWRRSREEMHNPGGYLQSLCTFLIVPDWYVPFEKRKELGEALRRRELEAASEKARQKAQEEEQIAAMNAVWDSLTEDRRTRYRTMALESMPRDITPPAAVMAIAKLLAWKELQPDIPAAVG